MNINKSNLQAVILFSTAMTLLPIPLSADMTLKQGLQQTLNTNPEILADSAAAKSNEHAIQQAKAGYYPRVDVTATGGYEYTKNKYRANTCAAGVACVQKKFRTTPSVSVVQNIFDGLKTPTDVSRARAEQLQAEMKLLETKELIAYRFINAAADVRRFQRLYRLSKQNIASHEQILSKVNKLIKGGRASTADRYSVSSRLNDGKSASVDIRGDQESAVARFKSISGVEPDRLRSTAIADELIPNTLQEAISIALKNNRSVVLARAALDVAKTNLDAADTAFYPTVSVEADASRAKNTAGRDGFSNNLQVLGVVRYNLVNGGRDLAKSKAVSERVAQARYRLESALRSAEEEVRRSWAERDSARVQSIELRKSVNDKKRVKEAFAKQYDLGTRTLLDVLDAENEHFLAKGSLITVDATQDLTEARLLATMGVLLEKFDLSEAAQDMQDEINNLAYAAEYDRTQKSWLQEAAFTKEGEASLEYSADKFIEKEQDGRPTSNTQSSSLTYEAYDFDNDTMLGRSKDRSTWVNPNEQTETSPTSNLQFHDFDKQQTKVDTANNDSEESSDWSFWESLTSFSSEQPVESIQKGSDSKTVQTTTVNQKSSTGAVNSLKAPTKPKRELGASVPSRETAYYDFDQNKPVSRGELGETARSSSPTTSVRSNQSEQIHDFYADAPSWWTSLQPDEK